MARGLTKLRVTLPLVACAVLLTVPTAGQAHTKHYPTTWSHDSITVNPDTGSGWTMEGHARISSPKRPCIGLRFWDLNAVLGGRLFTLDGGITSFGGWLGFGAQGPASEVGALNRLSVRVRSWRLRGEKNKGHRHICKPTTLVVYQAP